MRNQEPSENVTNYLNVLGTIARNFAHNTITPDEILCDHLLLGMYDNRVGKSLLHSNDLTL